MSESANQKQVVKQIDTLFRNHASWRKWLVPGRRHKRSKYNTHAPLVHVKNEQNSNARSIYQSKLAGLSKGFPDLQLMVHFEGYAAGLLIENKFDNNKRTEEQIMWSHWLNSHGYICVECRTVKQALDTVIAYMQRRL